MNDIEYEAIKDKINYLVEYWKSKVGLADWLIKLRFHRSSSEHQESVKSNSVATCFPAWTYFDSTIHWNCEELYVMDDDELEHIVVHELCHCIVNPMENPEKDDQEEFVVTNLAMIFVKFRKYYEGNDKIYSNS